MTVAPFSGTLVVNAAASAPGKAPMRFSSCSKNARAFGPSEYFIGDRESVIVSRFLGLNPASICRSRENVFSISPAPINNTSAKATSETTSKDRAR